MGEGRDEMDYIFVFENTNSAMKAEKCLLDENLKVTALPLPNQVGAGCGICLKVGQEEWEAASETLRKSQISGIRVYAHDEEAGGIVYRELQDFFV